MSSWPAVASRISLAGAASEGPTHEPYAALGGWFRSAADRVSLKASANRVEAVQPHMQVSLKARTPTQGRWPMLDDTKVLQTLRTALGVPR